MKPYLLNSEICIEQLISTVRVVCSGDFIVMSPIVNLVIILFMHRKSRDKDWKPLQFHLFADDAKKCMRSDAAIYYVGVKAWEKIIPQK